MDYTGLRRMSDADRGRLITTLTGLRTGLRRLPAKGPGNFLLATWNIREFGGTKYRGRIPDALYCIAECISRFDLVAVQEVRQDLVALKQVVRILGRDWDYIYNDVSLADGGNGERLAFLFNRSRVRFTGLAGELVLPSKSASKLVAQIARTPFICGFQSGWAKFNLCTVHIYYGEGKKDDPKRIEEIEKTAKLLADKAKSYINLDDPVDYSPENLVLLGDFNIFGREDATFQALTKNRFVIPEPLLRQKGSNVSEDKFYDQIAFFKETRGIECSNAGVFNFYQYAFNDPKLYKGVMPASAAFNTWRTFQMSDHLIMWTEFNVDKTDAYLKTLMREQASAPKGGTKKAATKKTAKTAVKKTTAKTKAAKKKAAKRS
ncbi:endonuclease/exonuclease/phosphatase family protein [Rhodopseudomonas palustris]|uniref:endonuclease/exonuclease/phosphatase family protein n=1 Tax=Rhodopseudomonas palustris TaxID=1076 RepID=UPI000E5A82D1|nr:endonuclease/exonuclease/phosphatase family protein [Rhodopseudomonas palustris]QLH69578.1 endonuclease/exonuclease/phosphatase family protein [Rhodopseudomonas palustris]RIA03166.1 endonuclease [Rhodopseudomonas palustris]